jgi:4-hydroxy-tetrahydrodipicolinate synthase
VGTNCTHQTIKNIKHASRLGADAFMVVVPYYNRPSQEGLFLHFSAIAEATNKPIIIYSSQLRCGIDVDVSILAKLFKKYPHVCGLKEAGTSCNRVSQVIKELGPDFCVLSGDDSLTLPFMAIGGRGVIGVAANLIPEQVVEMVKYALDNDLEKASDLNKRYYPLFRTLFAETSPIPIKHALWKCKRISSPEVRLPLCELQPSNATALENTLKTLNLIKK